MIASRLYDRRCFCATLAFIISTASIAAAQLPDFSNFKAGLSAGPRAAEELKIEAKFATASGDTPAMLFVTAEIAAGRHISAVDQGKLPDGDGPGMTVITVANDPAYKVVGAFKPIEQPKSRIDQKVWTGLELREHYDKVTWYAPVEIARGVDPANITINGNIETQVCDESSCMPFDVPFAAKLGEGMTIPVAQQAAPEVHAANTSLWAIAGTGLLGGLILNLMPCVLPVIGLKVLSFAEQAGRSRAKILTLNLSYVAGLFVVFMVLATLAASVQLGISDSSYDWGQLNTLTWFKVAMTALVFAMALSFLGVWEIPIPGFAASNHAMELSAQEGPFGAFCLGIFTTILATPCSGPFLGSLLGYTISQPPLVTYMVFGSIGLGMALPYILIGLFPSLVAWLPKPGQWMETFKHLLGFVLLATVVFLFSAIHPDWFLSTLSLLFAIWFACWLVGHTPVYAPLRMRAAAWIGGILVASTVGYLAFAPAEEPPLPWQPYSRQALAVARAQGKTVLVDFTAKWCLTCKTNLKYAINTAEVKSLVEQNDVVTLLADWTHANPEIESALRELNSRSIPLLVIYPADPDREMIVLRDVVTMSTVLEALADAGPSLTTNVARAGDEQAAVAAPAASRRR